MSKIFVVINEATATDPQSGLMEWFVLSADNLDNTQQQGTFDAFLADYRLLAEGEEVTVFLPGSAVTRTTVRVPAKNNRQMMQALPFVVEEEIASNLEDVHLAIGAPTSSGAIPVAVVDRVVMTAWYDKFREAQIPLRHICALSDAIDVSEHELSIVCHDDRALIQVADQSMECEVENLPDMLPLLITDDSDVQNVNFAISNDNKQQVEAARNIAIQLEAEDTNFTLVNYDGPLLPYLASDYTFNKKHDIDLLQGEFRGSAGFNGGLLQYWPVAAAIIFCVVAQIAFNLASGYFFHTRGERAQQIALEAYKNAFPEEQNVQSISRQLEAKLLQVGVTRDTGFSTMFGLTFDAIKETSPENQFTLNQFRYDNKSKELRLDLDAPSVALVDTLKQNIVNQGLDTEILSANEQDAGIKASLLIKGGQG